ncbi:MAG: hypothetical protein ACRDJM_06835, partial [Actinomycetota bacterium]
MTHAHSNRNLSRVTLGVVAALLSTVLVRVSTVAPALAGVPASAPADRYQMAGGCWAVLSLVSGGYVVRAGDGFAATAASVAQAEPFRFQATDLGRYLLFGSAQDFFA